MKKLSAYIFVLIMLQACGQDKKKKETKNPTKDTEITRNMEITAQNFVDKMVAQVPNFKEHPFYYLRISQNYCVYEILVNDFPVEKNYGLGVAATPIEINHAILKSGPQKVTYRLYPINDLEKEEFEGSESIPTLIPETNIRIKVIRVNDQRKYDSTSDENIVITHHSVNKKGTEKFIASGQKYYEFSFTFDAKVPYENKGWSDGQDLTKLDQKLLETKILEYYKSYQKVYADRDLNAFAGINFKDELRNSISEYRDKAMIQRVWEEGSEDVKIKEKDFQPLKNYKIQFYGDGKIVSLLQNNIEDIRLRGGSALWFFFKKEGRLTASFPGAYLFLPKGKKLEDGLQMME
jgi:hypothetical protein